MDRCAIFVDAGYVLAEGGALCCGTKRRSAISCDYPLLVKQLNDKLSIHCGLPVLRTYWYDAARQGVPTMEHLKIAELANVKVRLGRLAGGRQKGVDSLIYRDLMTLSRERAMATAFLLAGDEDLREGVVAAQDMGIRVAIIGIPTTGGNQAVTLLREADEHIMLQESFWRTYFSRVGTATTTLPESASQPIPKTAQPRPSQGEDLQQAQARLVGESFALDWTARTTPVEVRDLLTSAPRIPRELDIQLIVQAERSLGPLRDRQDLKIAIRAGFWASLKRTTEAIKRTGTSA